MKRGGWLILTASLVIALDVLTKILASHHRFTGQWWEIHIGYFKNDSGPFNLALGPFWLTMAACIALGWALVGLIRSSRWVEQFFLVLILTGGFSNVIERWHAGYITDVLRIGGAWFNVADSAIVIGLIGLLITQVKKRSFTPPFTGG
jgi:lipoprotein signal peptidase